MVGRFTDARAAVPPNATSPLPLLRRERDKPWREIDRVTMGSDDIKLRNDRSFALLPRSPTFRFPPKIFHRFRIRVHYIGSIVGIIVSSFERSFPEETRFQLNFRF